MKRLTKNISFLLAILLLSGCILSCSETAENTQKDPADEPILNRETEAETEEETADPRLSADLDIMDLDGMTFHIYGGPPNDGGDWHVHDMIVEEMNGEVLNDSIFERNLFLEETYHFNIELTESTGSVQQEIENFVASGETTYHVFGTNAGIAANIAKSGYSYNLNSLPYFDFTQSYWSPSLVQPLSIEGRLFMVVGDISVVPKEGVRAFYFNKGLQADYQLESPYELVREGTWTYDKMFSMMETATHDTNGDGKMDKKDRYGMMGQSLLGMVLYQGSGESIVSKDENDSFILTVENERSVNALLKITELIQERKEHILFNDDWRGMLTMFENNQALFYTEVMLHIETMRGFDVDLGIIPTPKFDEQQENYSHFIDSTCNIVYSLPISNPDPDTTAYILEVISAASRHYITPAYYDVCLKAKYARDEESSQMLDIIFSTYHLDLSAIYGWGNMHGYLNSAFKDGGNIVSTIAALRGLTTKAIGKTIDMFYKNDSWKS